MLSLLRLLRYKSHTSMYGKITFLFILYFNNLHVSCTCVGNICCIDFNIILSPTRRSSKQIFLSGFCIKTYNICMII
jgi:hypothetical protein